MARATPCFKVILCGEYGVGKSSIFRRFLDNSFSTDAGPRSAIGLDHFSKEFKVEGKIIKLELWDTAGIERFATLSSSYFQNASAAILCYSRNDRETFNTLSQHILEIIMHSETAKIFLCGNKSDLECDDEITDVDIQNFMEQCSTVLSATFQVSCKENRGVADMFRTIAAELLDEAQHKFSFDPSRIRPHETPHAPLEKSNCC